MFATVTTKKDGFRRAGRAWSGTEHVELTRKQIEALQSDSTFTVEEIDEAEFKKRTEPPKPKKGDADKQT